MRNSASSQVITPTPSLPEMPAGLFIIELEERLELASVAATTLKCLEGTAV